MKKILLILLALPLFTTSNNSFAAIVSKTCNLINSNTAGCMECFEESVKVYGCNPQQTSCEKEGLTGLFDDLTNTGNTQRVQWIDGIGPGTIEEYELQANADWMISDDPIYEMPSNFGPVSNANNGDRYTIYEPNSTKRWTQMKTASYYRFDRVTSMIDKTQPVFRVDFVPKTQSVISTNPTVLGAVESHRQCVFYNASFCGDGVIDNGSNGTKNKGEQCDDGNMTNGDACSSTCQNVVVQPSVCESLTLTPSTALIDTPINYTCTATNATGSTTYNITKNDVSIGTIPTGTIQFNTAGTYTIKCIVDAKTPTPAACIKTVTVTNPPAPTIPSIFIDKDDSTPGTPDSDGNDIQKVEVNGTATFTIRFVNNGNEALKTVVIDDPLASDCNRNSGQTAALYATGASTNFDVGETFTYQCTKTNVTSSTFPNDRNTITIKGVGVTSGQNVTDSDITEIFLEEQVNPDISIEKDDTDNLDDEQELDEGDTAKFSVKVTNNGDESLENLEITDELSPDCDRSISETKDLIRNIGNKDSVFDPGEKFAYICKETSVNTDTFPDEINTVCIEANGTDSNEDVDDCDDTKILLNEESLMCEGIESSEGTFGGAPFRSTITCDAPESATCEIEVSLDGEIVNTYDSCSKSITFPDTGEYSVACIVDDERSSECEMNITVEAMTEIPTGAKIMIIGLLSLLLAAFGTHMYQKKAD